MIPFSLTWTGFIRINSDSWPFICLSVYWLILFFFGGMNMVEKKLGKKGKRQKKMLNWDVKINTQYEYKCVLIKKLTLISAWVFFPFFTCVVWRHVLCACAWVICVYFLCLNLLTLQIISCVSVLLTIKFVGAVCTVHECFIYLRRFMYIQLMPIHAGTV